MSAPEFNTTGSTNTASGSTNTASGSTNTASGSTNTASGSLLHGKKDIQQQPVTWQKRHPLRTEGEWENTNEHDAKWWANDANWWANNAKLWEIRPLYTHPAPAQQPLTVEVIADIAMQSGAYDDQLLAFARAIEAKHGIKEKP